MKVARLPPRRRVQGLGSRAQALGTTRRLPLSWPVRPTRSFLLMHAVSHAGKCVGRVAVSLSARVRYRAADARTHNATVEAYSPLQKGKVLHVPEVRYQV